MVSYCAWNSRIAWWYLVPMKKWLSTIPSYKSLVNEQPCTVNTTPNKWFTAIYWSMTKSRPTRNLLSHFLSRNYARIGFILKGSTSSVRNRKIRIPRDLITKLILTKTPWCNTCLSLLHATRKERATHFSTVVGFKGTGHPLVIIKDQYSQLVYPKICTN